MFTIIIFIRVCDAFACWANIKNQRGILLAVNRRHSNFGAYGLWVIYPASYTAYVGLFSLWSLSGWLLMVQWLTDGCKVCADTSCVVEYTMGGCVSCEFTRWCHGSRWTTWWEYRFAYIYSNIHVEVVLVVIDSDWERRVCKVKCVRS